MIRAVQSHSNLSIHAVVQRILRSGEISRQDYSQLASAILSDQQIGDEERRQINRVFDYMQIGRLKLVD